MHVPVEVWLATFVATAIVLFYSLAGYAMLCALGAMLPRRSSATAPLPRVSVIIPAHNEAVILRAKLENALAIDYPRELLEILVASDGSVDATVEIAREFEDRGVRVLELEPRRGKASVLNDAVAASQGEVLCLCDANVMFRADAVRMLVAPLADRSIGAVTGEVRLASHESNFGEGESAYYRLERAVQLGESRIGSLMGVDGGMYVLRRELFRALPADTILDDFVISMNVIRQGLRVVYEPRALAHENGTPLAMQEYRRRVRVSAGAVQALRRRDFPPLGRPVEHWQFLSHKLVRWLGPVWLFVLFVSNAMLWNVHPVFRWTLLAQVAVYALAAIATVSVRFRQSRLGGLPFYFVMSHVAIAVGIVKGLLNRQKATWAQAARSLPEPVKVHAVDEHAS